MSTPQEKAIELVSAYARIDGYVDSIDLSKCEFEKKCALIAVDEVIKNTIITYEDCFNHDHWEGGYDTKASREAVTYWQEVKQEIEKL